MISMRGIDRARVAAALVFAASVAVTIAWCGSMTDMPGMRMPGGWTMSMAWMRMPGQSWTAFAGTFLGMWMVMMVAMMMPAFAPEALRFLRAQSAGRGRDKATLAFAAGYFGVWTAAGIAILPPGLAFAELAMRFEGLSRVTPLLAGVAVMIAGASQFTGWKLRRLASCRHDDGCCRPSSDYRGALRDGARLGMQCVQCCAGLTLVLLVIGVMDLLAMAAVAVAISAERLLPWKPVIARMTGAMLLATGAWMSGESARLIG